MPARIIFNVKAFAVIRSSQGAQDHIAKIAEGVADAAGPGFVVEHRQDPRSRARSAVIAATPEAQAAAARDQVLITALARFR